MTTGARAPKQVTPYQGWTTTFNNYSEHEYAVFLQWCRDRATSREFYYVIGREVGASGTPHLQCACWQPTRFRFPTAKNSAKVTEFRETDSLFKEFRHKMHNEGMRGTPAQAFEYCMKDDNYMTNAEVVERKYVAVSELDRLYALHRDFLHAERNKAYAWYDFLEKTWSHNWYLRNYDLKLGYRIPAETLAAMNETFSWCGDIVGVTTRRTLVVG